MKKVLLLIITFSCIGMAQAKNVDSLFAVLKNSPDDEALILKASLWLEKNRDYKRLDSFTLAMLKKEGLSDSTKVYLRASNALSSIYLPFSNPEKLARFRLIIADSLQLQPLTRARVYQNIGLAYYYNENLDSTLFFFKRAAHYYKLLEQQSHIVRITINISIVLSKLGKKADALNTFNKVRAKAGGLTDRSDQGRFFASLSDLYYEIFIPDSSLEYGIKAIESFKSINDSNSVSKWYGNTSQFFSNADKYAEALEYAKVGLQYRPKGYDKSYSYLALARAYFGVKKFDSAVFYNKKVLELNNMAAKNTALANISGAYLSKDDYSSAVNYGVQALDFRIESGLKKSKATIYMNLAEGYLGLEKYSETVVFLDSLFQELKRFPDFDDYSHYYRIKALLSISKGNKAQALKWLDLEDQYQDSLNNQKADRRIEGLKILHEVGVKNDQIVALKTENELKELKVVNATSQLQLRNRMLLIVALCALVLVSVTILLVMYTRKVKGLNRQLSEKNVEIAQKNEQLTVINKEIYHRTKNHMQTMGSLLGLQKDMLSDQLAKDLLEENEHRMNAMGLVHKRLFRHESLSVVEMQSFTESLIKDLAFSFNVEALLEYNVSLDSFHPKVDAVIPIALILNECITNSLKYAITDNSKLLLSITAQKQEGKYELRVQDNGKGFNLASIDNTDSFGLMLIKSMAMQLNGQVTFTNKGGAVVELYFSA